MGDFFPLENFAQSSINSSFLFPYCSICVFAINHLRRSVHLDRANTLALIKQYCNIALKIRNNLKYYHCNDCGIVESRDG